MNEKTLSVLEYHKITARLVGHCAFSASMDLARNLQPTSSFKKAKAQLEETSEARHLLSVNDMASVGGARDIREKVKLTSRGGVLEAHDLLDIKATLVSARRLKNLFEKSDLDPEAYPRLREIASALPPSLGLVDAITRTISEKGDVLDSASQKLASIRSERRVTHDRLMTKLQKIVSNNASILQEALITQRDGRYVVPLQAQNKGKLKGIIHDQSSSGVTLFVEPLSTVDMNNKARELQLAERDEERRVLAELCEQIGENYDVIRTGVEALAELDLVFAKAKYADAIRASEPLLSQRLKAQTSKKKPKEAPSETTPTFKLIQARHPLLDPATVVPLDIPLDPETRALVITGPNTGGKTITLKTAGLLALMAQSGLHIPAESGSALPCFGSVYADIGDEQSIEQSLSTFSGHVKNISAILKKADENSLVIFDELGAGTDPQEGAALARAILTELVERNSLAFIATHYPELKAFAHTTQKVVNASLEFNLHTLRPTYKLTIGLPGRSNALAIAKRLGLPQSVLDAAKSQIDPNDIRTDDMLDDIHKQRKIARKDRNKAQRARIEAHRLRRELDKELEKIEEERAKILNQARDEAQKQLEAMQAEIQAMRRRLEEAEKPLEEIESVEDEIQAVEQAIPEPVKKKVVGKQSSVISEQKPALSGDPDVGDTVEINSLGTQGVVTSLGKGEVEVQIGALRTWAKLKNVTLKKRAVREEKKPEPQARVSTPNVALPKMELDMRGERAEDALDILERYIDQAYVGGMPFVRVIHGKGTGRLRDVVRDALRRNPNVKSFEEGKHDEGGAGVTVVKFN